MSITPKQIKAAATHLEIAALLLRASNPDVKMAREHHRVAHFLLINMIDKYKIECKIEGIEPLI